MTVEKPLPHRQIPISRRHLDPALGLVPLSGFVVCLLGIDNYDLLFFVVLADIEEEVFGERLLVVGVVFAAGKRVLACAFVNHLAALGAALLDQCQEVVDTSGDTLMTLLLPHYN